MNPLPTSGEWLHERLYVLKELERLNLELRSMTADLAVYRDKVDGKQLKDINQAHIKIRGLEGSVRTARAKTWAASSAAAFLGVVVIELLRFVLK